MERYRGVPNPPGWLRIIAVTSIGTVIGLIGCVFLFIVMKLVDLTDAFIRGINHALAQVGFYVLSAICIVSCVKLALVIDIGRLRKSRDQRMLEDDYAEPDTRPKDRTGSPDGIP